MLEGRAQDALGAAFVLLHGGSKDSQSAQHWLPFLTNDTYGMSERRRGTPVAFVAVAVAIVVASVVGVHHVQWLKAGDGGSGLDRCRSSGSRLVDIATVGGAMGDARGMV